MRVVLCHTCWTWVLPSSASCPECQQSLDLDEPDPPLTAVANRLGAVIGRLDAVDWLRKQLPVHGELWGTTTGLLFWPLLTKQPNGAWCEPYHRSPHRHWTWQTFCSWWQTSAEPATPFIADAADLKGESGIRIAERFFDAPGAAFFPREHLIRITLRRRRWTISRTLGRTVRMAALSSPHESRTAWRRFVQDDPNWRTLAAIK